MERALTSDELRAVQRLTAEALRRTTAHLAQAQLALEQLADAMDSAGYAMGKLRESVGVLGPLLAELQQGQAPSQQEVQGGIPGTGKVPRQGS